MLNAQIINEDLEHPSTLPPGGSSRVSGNLTGYEPIRDIQDGKKLIQSAAWIKNQLAVHRKPSAINGEWLRETEFFWDVKATDGRYVVFAVVVGDVSFDEFYQRYHTKTLINIATNVFVLRTKSNTKRDYP